MAQEGRQGSNKSQVLGWTGCGQGGAGGTWGSALVLTGQRGLRSAQEASGQGALQPGMSHTKGEVTGVAKVCRLSGKEDERKAWRRAEEGHREGGEGPGGRASLRLRC